MKRTRPWALVLGLLLPLVLTAPARAIVIEISPPSQSVALGSPVTVDLNISGLGAGVAPSIGAWDIDLTFDTTILTATFVTFGTSLDVTHSLANTLGASVIAGGVNAFEISADSVADLNLLQPGAFTLATFGFSATGAGTTPLNIGVNALGDAAGNPLAASLVNGSITVTSVPEPSALLLLAFGLAGLGVPRRRRQVG